MGSTVKGQKMAQNDKKLCLSHTISQEAYIIWSWFLVHKCKMMTSPVVFFFLFFSRFWFSGLLGGINGQKLSQNDKQLCLSHSRSQEPYLTWLQFLVHMCKIISPAIFSIFSKFYFFFFWFLEEGKCAKNDPYLPISTWHTVSQEL